MFSLERKAFHTPPPLPSSGDALATEDVRWTHGKKSAWRRKYDNAKCNGAATINHQSSTIVTRSLAGENPEYLSVPSNHGWDARSIVHENNK